jgi:hypothetical protein
MPNAVKQPPNFSLMIPLVLEGIVLFQWASANLMNKVPTALLPDMFTYMSYNDLLAFNRTNHAFFDSLKPIFQFSKLCGINGPDIWPKLKIDLEHAESFEEACLGHIKQWNSIFPAILIIATPDFDENVASVIDLISNFADIELNIQTFVSDIDLKILLRKLHGKKLVSVLYSTLTMIKTDLNDFKVKRIAFISPILSPENVEPLALLFAMIENIQSLTSFSIIQPLSTNSYDWLALPDVDYKFENSKLKHFEIIGVVMPPLLLHKLAKALPRSLLLISLKPAEISEDADPASFVYALLKQKTLLTELVLENFIAGFDKLSIVSITRQVSSGVLKRLSLSDSRLSAFAYTKLAHALPSSRLTSLDVSATYAYDFSKELELLFRSIPLTPTLTHLNLDFCALREHASHTLAKNLGQLKELKMRYNNIGLSGARGLARHFSTSSLVLLLLWGNSPAIYDDDLVGRINTNGEVINVRTDGDAPRGRIHKAVAKIVDTYLGYMAH